MNKKKELDVIHFASISSFLETEGFKEISGSRLRKIYRVYDLVPPDVIRTRDVLERVSFIKEINGYVIYVHTSFNKVEKCFTKGTRIFFIVDDIRLSVKRLTRKFNRIGQFSKKVNDFADFLVSELEDRWPITTKNNFASLKEKSHDRYIWEDENHQKIRDFFAHAAKFPSVLEGQKERVRYQKRRKKLGIKKNLRDIKKTYQKRS